MNLELQCQRQDKPFVAAVQPVLAVPRQKPAQSWYHRHILAPAAVTPIQASSLLDVAPTSLKITIKSHDKMHIIFSRDVKTGLKSKPITM